MTRLTWLRINEASPLGFLLITSFLVRLALTPLFYDDFNAWAYGAFGSLLIGGHDPYLVVARDPTLLHINPWRYPPFYLLFTVPSLLAKIATGQTLVFLAALKTPLAVCDVISTLFLYKILATHFSKSIAFKGAALFTFNPAVVFNTVVTGFSDPIAIMFTVIAFYYFLSYKSAGSSAAPRLYKSGLFLGLAIIAKIYPLFLLPIFIRDSKDWKDRLLLLATATLPVLVFSLPFLIADPYSYVYMLTVKNVGGERPLFGALRFPISVELALLGILALVLIWIYTSPLPMYSRLVLVFLWINLATISTTFQYLTWGIPFFILLLYQKESAPKMLPLYPMIEVFSASVFNGFYNIYTGTSGPYYWMYHVLQEQIVVFRAYPLIGEIATPLSSISILVTIYYLVRIGSSARLQSTWNRLPNIHLPGWLKLPKTSSVRKTTFALFLVVLAVLSWTYVATHSAFEDFSYPTLQGNVFNTSFQFHSSSLDYQLVYAGNGTYSISQGSGYIALGSSQTNSSSYLYRGWLDFLYGFHPSNSVDLDFKFKLDYFPSITPNMVIANFTGGYLFIARNATGTSFDLFNSALSSNRTIASGDTQWHNFTINYAQQNTTIRLDTNTLVLAATTFTWAILGNQKNSLQFGKVEYSDLQISIKDFPSGPSFPLLALVALAVPLAATVVAFGILPGGFLRLGQNRREIDPETDTNRTTHHLSEKALE